MAPWLVHLTLALGAVLMCLPGAAALKDTIKNRMKLADKYMDENPVDEGMEAMARYGSGVDVGGCYGASRIN